MSRRAKDARRGRSGAAPMKTPELRTERLILRPYLRSMVHQDHVDWLKDLEVVKFSEQRHLYHDLETQEAYVARLPPNNLLWAIEVMMDDEYGIIGTIGVSVDPYNQIGDIGILIGEKAVWGRGYATEAWAAVMHWCFEELKLRKIECGCMSPNLGMRQVAVKTGMRIEGGKVSHFLLDGTPVDVVYYGKMRE